MLVLCLVLAGLYGFMYYKIKTTVDEAILSMSPYLEITYQGIKTPIDGSIALTNLQVDPIAVPPLTTGEKISIESIELRLSNLSDFVFFKGKMEDMKTSIGMIMLGQSQAVKTDPLEIIPKIQLKINHMRMKQLLFEIVEPANKEPYILFKDEDGSDVKLFESEIAQLLAPSCGGDSESIKLSDLQQKLGLSDNVDASINLDYEYNKYASAIDLKYGITSHNIADMFIKGTISGVNSTSSLLANQKELLTRIYFGYQDLGFYKRLNAYCAKIEGIKTEDYLDHQMESLKDFLPQIGITLSDSFYSLIKGMFAGSKITVKLMPESMASLQMLERYEVSDLPEVLGMSIEMDGKEINNFFVDYNENIAEEYFNSIADISRDKEIKKEGPKKAESSKNEKVKKKTTKKKKKSFVKIPIQELKNFVNKYALIKLKSGRKFKGLIIGSEENMIILKYKAQGGSMEMPINFEKIDAAAIYK